MIFDNDQYLLDYEPIDFFNKNFKSSQKNSFKSFIENINEEFAYKLYEKYTKSKKDIKLIKDRYDSDIAPIIDKINSISSELNNLSILFKNNSRYEVTEEGFISKKNYLDLIWISNDKKLRFLDDFKNLLKLIKEINDNKYKKKFHSQFMTGKAFHNGIEHIKLFEFKDELMNSVTDCMDIYSELFYGDFEHYYIKGAGRQGTARVFWSDLDEMNEFFHFVIPSEKYTTILEDQQTKFEEKILPFLEFRIGKFERDTQASSNFSYVYVLSNKSYPNTFKVGSTSGTPRDRATELTSTGVLHPFKVSFQIQLKNAEYYELKTHKILESYRVRNNREFFKIDLIKIKDCLNQISKISEKGSKKITLVNLKKEINL